MPRPVVVQWSGGKDSLLALAQTLQDDQLEVVVLVTTVTRDYGRTNIRGVRSVSPERQTRSLVIPLYVATVDAGCINDEYEAVLPNALLSLAQNGVRSAIAGDNHVTDVRKHRERFLVSVDMAELFPLWSSGPAQLARRFCASGHEAVICCVDARVLFDLVPDPWETGSHGKSVSLNVRMTVKLGR